MPQPDFGKLVASQREFFLSGATRPAAWRKTQLEAVKALFADHHDELCGALWKDLRRSVNDADLMDVAYCAKEAEYTLKNIDEWMKPQREPMPLVAALAAGNTAVLKPSEVAVHCAAAAARLVPKYFDPRAVSPGVRYPPYSQNTLQRMVVNQLMP